MFSSTTSNAIHDDDFVPSSSSTVPEPFVTPAKSELFSLDKRRTDSLFRLPEPSLLSQERVPHAATVVAAASTTSNGTFVHPTPQPPTRRNSGHPRDVFMLVFGGSVHRITVPPSAQLPVAALLRHTIVDSSGAPFEYHSPSAAHTGGAGSWALVELPAAVSASSKGGVRLLDATDEHVFALTGDGLLYRWPLTVKGSFGGARALPRPVARETGGSGAMRFQSLSCGATMALAVTSDGLVYRVGRDADVVPKVPSALPGALDGADDADLVATWDDDADERSPDGAASSSAVGSLLLAARVQMPTSIRVSKVVCGEAHRLLLTTGGSVYAFGDGKFGRLGLGDERSSGVVRCVMSLSSRRCVDIAVGAYHSAAVVDDGRLLTWGHGKYGQLGHGTQDNEFSPREVSAVSQHRIVRVVASTMFTAVLTVNGDVYTCGFPMTPAEDASKYSGAVLSSSPRLALSGMHIVQLGASLAGGLFAVSGTIEGASDKNPVELN
jgi:hypothetical protein